MADEVQLELPTHLRDQQVMVSWCTLFLRTVSKETPSNSMHEDLAERESSHWWKAKARAYANVNRLFTRFVSLALSFSMST